MFNEIFSNFFFLSSHLCYSITKFHHVTHFCFAEKELKS